MTTPALARPELWCPIEPALHPDHEEVSEHALTWLRRYGYVTTRAEEETARAARFGELAARVHPHGTLPGVQYACEWLMWLFLQDDDKVEGASGRGDTRTVADHLLRCIQVLHDPQQPPGNVHMHALADLRRRLDDFAAPEHVQRLLFGLMEYFAAAGPEAIYWSLRNVPTVSDYQQLRESTVFMRAGCFVLNEIATNCPLPTAVWATPEIQSVSRTAARIVGYTNDILSGPRELAWPGALNLINCIAQEQQCPLPEALEAAVDLHREETASFLRQAAQVIRHHDDEPTRTYIDGLRTWIRGNLDWSLATDRYAIKAPTPPNSQAAS
ncbi:MAG: hypothetical protein HOY79_14485 [Streptomyces sp.]|nr:hypothetical protein [Streptomyces sp.]